MDIYDVLTKFIDKWFIPFFIVCVITSVVLGSLSVISAYAILIVLILCSILKYLRRIAEALESRANQE